MFLIFGILGYSLNGLAMLIDKILIKNSLPNPLVYAFYINILGFLFLPLLPFFVTNFNPEVLIYGTLSGIFFVFALISLFQSLKTTELTVATPVVGSLHPLFSLLLGSIFLGQALTNYQLLAFFILILGAAILTYHLWSKGLAFNKSLYWMIIAGVFFGLSSVFVKEAFVGSNFITGFLVTRVSAACLVATFLFSKRLRQDIFHSNITKGGFLNKTSFLLFFGQSMGALAGICLTVAVYFQQPALVNALFGVQYVVILISALILTKSHPHLLAEHLSRGSIFQKILGAVILSAGVFLLST